MYPFYDLIKLLEITHAFRNRYDYEIVHEIQPDPI